MKWNVHNNNFSRREIRRSIRIRRKDFPAEKLRQKLLLDVHEI